MDTWGLVDSGETVLPKTSRFPEAENSSFGNMPLLHMSAGAESGAGDSDLSWSCYPEHLLLLAHGLTMRPEPPPGMMSGLQWRASFPALFGSLSNRKVSGGLGGESEVSHPDFRVGRGLGAPPGSSEVRVWGASPFSGVCLTLLLRDDPLLPPGGHRSAGLLKEGRRFPASGGGRTPGCQ